MGYNVVILESAEHDLKEIRAYIVKEFSIKQWRITYAKMKETIANLRKFPLTGSIPDEIEKLNLTQYRQILSGMNRIIYEVRQDTIYIHAVIDVRREMNAFLTRRLMRV